MFLLQNFDKPIGQRNVVGPMKQVVLLSFPPALGSLKWYIYRLIRISLYFVNALLRLVGARPIRLSHEASSMSSTDRHWVPSIARKPSIPSFHLKSLRDSEYMVRGTARLIGGSLARSTQARIRLRLSLLVQIIRITRDTLVLRHTSRVAHHRLAA